MKKNLLLYILLGFLVIMNGFFLFKHFSSVQQRGPENSGPADFMAKELQFDAAQLQKFKQMDAGHREEMELVFDDIKQSKDALFQMLTADVVHDAAIDSLAEVISQKEKKREVLTFKFFRSVSEICTVDQKLRFTSIIKDALHQPGGKNAGGPPNGPGPGNRPSPGNGPPPPGH